MPLIPESMIPSFAIGLLTAGFAAVAIFCIEEAEDDEKGSELFIGLLASLMLGFGFIFFLLWCGAFL